MVEGITPVRTDAFAMSQAGVEHHYSSANGMRRKYGEHPSLIVVLEVEKAIPRQHSVKSLAE
jgi:hypothetical protein